MTRVVVFHPAQQHAHQLAWALQERGLLRAFWSGIPVTAPGEVPPFWMNSLFPKGIKSVGVPKALRRHPLAFPVMLRASRRLPPGVSRRDFVHRVFHLFDWWFSRRVSSLKPAAVIGYENAAYFTFRAAKRVGARCFLDAASVHRATQALLADVEQTPYLAEIDRRKDGELANADRVLTCSALAAESYVSAGVPADRVEAVPLGADLPHNAGRWIRHGGPLRFVFAGGLHQLKAIDVILSAFRRLHAEGLRYRLTLAGVARQPQWRDEIRRTPDADYRPAMPQEELFRLFGRSDCLLLPSRFDSFGMVVAEAMACGTPAIVSTTTGAKEIIERFPRSGWIVECDEDSLYHCLKARILDREGVFAARAPALEASRHFTWTRYRARVGAVVEGWLR